MILKKTESAEINAFNLGAAVERGEITFEEAMQMLRQFDEEVRSSDHH